MRCCKTGVLVVIALLAFTGLTHAELKPMTTGKKVLGLDALTGITTPMKLNFERAPLGMILDGMAHAAGFTLIIDDEKLSARPISCSIEQTDLKTVLTQLAAEQKLVYEVRSPKELVVRDATQTKLAN